MEKGVGGKKEADDDEDGEQQVAVVICNSKTSKSILSLKELAACGRMRTIWEMAKN